MNTFQRARVSVKRQRGQTFILTGVVFLMGILIVATMLVNQAIQNTEISLQLRLPAIAILRQDELAFQQEWEESNQWLIR